jgi:hypothetical protein
MSKESAGLTAVVVGLVLLAASMYWSGGSDKVPMGFTEEEAAAYLDAGASLHDKAFQSKPGPGQKKATVSQEELAALKEKFAEQKANLDSTRSTAKLTSWILMGLGLVATVGGLFVVKAAGG